MAAKTVAPNARHKKTLMRITFTRKLKYTQFLLLFLLTLRGLYH